MKPAVVYLDSSDYSALSGLNRDDSEKDQVFTTLLNFSKSTKTIFAFSGVHLSEMAPLDPIYTPFAAERAATLVNLCGRNSFISFDRVIEEEISNLSDMSRPPVAALTDDATWFPDIDDSISPIKWGDVSSDISQVAKEHGLTRDQRRKLQRKLVKNGNPKPLLVTWLDTQGESEDLTSILESYPMRPSDALVIHKYVFGKVNGKEAMAAFVESLRDPSWMMQWFSKHADKLTPVNDWFRKPAAQMISVMKKIVLDVEELQSRAKTLSASYQIEFLTPAGWLSMQDQLLLDVANHMLERSHPNVAPCKDVERVRTRCPGLSTMVGTLHSSLRGSLGTGQRRLAESDFVDAVHAIYAPYCQFFRADRYMSPHISKQAARYGTTVIPKLNDLPQAIATYLETNNH